ncbi:hypothetical protein V6N13_069087 [Hibiscus sabdariffa]|uniref:GIR1-like zinc ribbon domain-containing protein n=1 Tax=Hibiscus sabdariffa TaxID=183260 RepID=A0ABR2QPH5_9ROSI
MSGRSDRPKLDLMLNLTPTTAANRRVESPSVPVSSSELSQESSCVSSELENSYGDSTLMSMSMSEYPSGCPVMTPMLLVGCPRCFMYVMLSEVDPKCPQCKSTVFHDFLNQEKAKWTRN